MCGTGELWSGKKKKKKSCLQRQYGTVGKETRKTWLQTPAMLLPTYVSLNIT